MENGFTALLTASGQLDQETNKDSEKDEIDNSIKFRIDFNNKHCLICNQALELKETQYLPCKQHQCHVICLKKMKRHLIEKCCPICTQFEEPAQKIYHLTLISFLRFEYGINDNRIFNCLQQEKCTLNYNLFLNLNYDKFPHCSYFLGLIKQYNGYTSYNLKEAVDWFTISSETDNHKMSQLYLGLIYLEKHNFDLAYKYLLKASRQQVGQAQFNLGKMYIDGQIKSNNRQIQKQEGFYWVNESIQNLDHEDYLGRVIIFRDNSNWVTEAEFLLGILLKKGIGTIRDFKQAEKMLNKGALRGHLDSQKELGFLYYDFKEYRDYSKSVYWFKKGSLYDDQECCLYLGIIYFSGGYGVNKDLSLSYKYFRLSTNMKKGLAESYLGDIYMYGLGKRPKNISIGIKYYKIAAAKGEKIAQYSLGLYNHQGTFPGEIPKNMLLAIDWYSKSAQQNYGIAQLKLGRLFLEKGPHRNKELAFKWLNKAIQNGYPEAKKNILEL